MTERKSFKRRVRDRMAKTGESYTAARARVDDKRERNRAARSRLAGSDDRMSDEAIERATGKRWEDWFRILDRWGARNRKHPEIARYLTEEHGVGGWWAQSVTVQYERARGLRLKHQQANGFSVSASKTISVPVDVLFRSFVDDNERARWLPDATMSLRTSRAGRSARFDWGEGSTRVVVDFTAKTPDKSTVSLAHERLPDADEAETVKAMWRQRLTELKALLES